MALWARFTDDGASKGVVAETFSFPTNPHPLFVPDWLWIEAPEETVAGSAFDGSAWTHPASVAPPPVEPPTPEPTYRLQLTPSEFRNAFTAFEEVTILEFSEARPDGEALETTTLRKVVGVFFDRLKDPRLTYVDLENADNLKGLALIQKLGLITAERHEAIAKGLPE